MPADVLATLGARVLAGIVSNPKAGISISVLQHFVSQASNKAWYIAVSAKEADVYWVYFLIQSTQNTCNINFPCHKTSVLRYHIDGLVQDCSNSIANSSELYVS